jgi:TRAP-type C4-dicarboxylate transport system permease small subunit
MEIIILLAAILTSAFVVFPILGFITNKRVSKHNLAQFILSLLIAIFYLVIGIWYMITQSGTAWIVCTTLIMVFAIVVIIVSSVLMTVGYIIPMHKHRKRKHESAHTPA